MNYDTEDLKNYARAMASTAGIDPDIFLKQIGAESNWNPNAINPESGAMGIAQFMPATAEWLGIKNPLDPYEAIRGSSRYMKNLKKQFGGSTRKALIAYNWGPGNLRNYGDKNLPKETQDYLVKILGSNADNVITVEPGGTVFIPFR